MPALVALMAGLVAASTFASVRVEGGSRRRRRPAHVSFAGPASATSNCVGGCSRGPGQRRVGARKLPVLGAPPQNSVSLARVALRVNPDFELKGSGMRMGGGRQAVGSMRSVHAVLAESAARLAFEGFTFAGSQNCTESIARPSAQRFALACKLAVDAPAPVRFVNLGGGFGVPYFPGEQPLDLAPIGVNLQALVERTRGELPDATVVVELGRYLVAEAGVYVTRVVDRKVSRGRSSWSAMAG